MKSRAYSLDYWVVIENLSWKLCAKVIPRISTKNDSIYFVEPMSNKSGSISVRLF